MPITPLTIHRSDQAPLVTADKSVHYELIEKAIPSWLQNTSPARVAALKEVTLKLPHWHTSASDDDHQALKDQMQLAWTAQNHIDQALNNLQDVYAFAKPLLQQALKDRYGVEDDVEDTWLRLYAPVNSAWWVHDFGAGTRSRTLSLLDAALHNFSNGETFSRDSEFITRPNAAGHFAVKNLKYRISIEQFKSLCRELDIGARYAQHLNEYLRSTNPVANNVLRHKVTVGQKHTLMVAAHMALMKEDIDQDAYDLIQGMRDDHEIQHWHGQRIGYYNLAMMDVALTGIVLITAENPAGGAPAPLLAYVPHDPEHPLKQYPSSLQFMAELTRQLRDTASPRSYQQFFSQFVDHQQRGHFFGGLNERLSQVKWQPAASGSNQPSWRDTPVDNPNLQFSLTRIEDDRATPFSGDIWDYFYRQKLNKIFNDAREIAISTEYADRMARWAWWDNLEKILSDIFNAALLVATPLVPGLGELMLAYTAYQLTDEVVEGLVDLAEGRVAEAGEQAIGVLESVVQLGAFAAGTAIGNVAQTRLSPFFEGLKPVQLADGRSRLWNPDLTPYQQTDLELPAHIRPDDLGIHQHQDQQIVRLDQQLFEVAQDLATGQYRIQHPQRDDAYAPTLQHNAQGAWVSETENPRDWQGATLMRRLGHATDGFSDTQLEQIREISGTPEAALRRMHMENAAPPPLLVDALQRQGASVPAPAALPAETASLFSEFPDLPDTVAQRILDNASLEEREQIARHKRLPLRLQSQARELQFETQSVRASQGLYHDALSNIDTERLALGTLRINSDLFGDLRIEVRESAFDGELRCSAGPENASQVRILIRDDAGKYQVRDGADQPIRAADDFFESLLQATERNGQYALGYGPGDAENLRQWIMAKTLAPTERRTILATPPIRATPVHETVLLVRGACNSRAGETLHQRILDLHRDFSDTEVDAFADALIAQGQPLYTIEQREAEYAELLGILKDWKKQHEKIGGNEFRDTGAQHLSLCLLDSFNRSNNHLGGRLDPNSYSLNLSTHTSPLDLETVWSKRPPGLQKFLDKITLLKLDNTVISSESNGFLRNFPNLRELSARGCELTTLPKSIGAMPRLERLQLSDNRIVFDANAVEQLKHLTYLEILRLDGNTFAQQPDIGRMPRLKVVSLKNTGLTTWPEGTLAKPRPRGFLLDLRGNPISELPEVVPGSAHAWVVAMTRLDVGKLSEPHQLHYQEMRRSLALPEEPIVTEDNQAVDVLVTHPEFWTDVPGWGAKRATYWPGLSDDPRSQRFLEVLSETKKSADYRAGGPARDLLIHRTVRMLDAVYIDTELREKLFTMAISPVNCADAGAQLFNNMGIQVLASEAYSYSTDPVQLEQRLVSLAKSAARLEQVNEIAHADVASRRGTTDDVEVYLAYQTGLAHRLNLPWQSEGMLYRHSSGVTDAMIDQAYDTVLALGEGDGLIDKMLEQQFWQDYLEQTYPIQVRTNKQLYEHKADALDSLQSTQREWVESKADETRAALRERLKALMDGLPLPESEVFADEPLSDDTYYRLFADLGDGEKNLFRQLTRRALKKA
jgi:hypothetical protein